MNDAQLDAMIAEFSKHFPDYYGYVNYVAGLYILFRNRQESFDPSNAIVTIRCDVGARELWKLSCMKD